MSERPFILDLCGGTASWSKPYIEAGYNVRIVDLLTTGEDVRLLHLPRLKVHGILAAPPCTHFALSGRWWWATKGNGPLLEGLSIVDACVRLVAVLKPDWWALENPEGRIRRYLGPPAYVFHPYEFGHPYSKKTLLWGNFNFPEKGPSVAPTYKYGRDDAPRPDRVLRRSMTCSGFAKAFFEANP